jgi:serine/threonine-protein kinase
LTIVAGIHIGDLIADKYRIERLLGSGGMGFVVAARHVQLDDQVAIKFLSSEMLSNELAVSRFDREARAAARIKNEHVVRVFDVGRLPNGAPYLVMEYLTGGDLGEWLRENGPAPVERAAEFVIQACAALADAHRIGIVHRDIKPSNLFCVEKPGQNPLIKLLDFGISKVSTPIDGSITDTSMAVGSPSYMSPEQMRSASQVDHRTDIWSLGVVLYELLTNRLPFPGATYPEICLKVVNEPPPRPSTYRADLPPPLEAIILKCLEKEREQRYSNVSELARALVEFAPVRARHTFEALVAGEPAVQRGGGSSGGISGDATSKTAVLGQPTSTIAARDDGRSNAAQSVASIPSAAAAGASPSVSPTPIALGAAASASASGDPTVAPVRPGTSTGLSIGAHTSSREPSRRRLVLGSASAVLLVGVAATVIWIRRPEARPDSNPANAVAATSESAKLERPAHVEPRARLEVPATAASSPGDPNTPGAPSRAVAASVTSNAPPSSPATSPTVHSAKPAKDSRAHSTPARSAEKTASPATPPAKSGSAVASPPQRTKNAVWNRRD